MAHWQLDEKEAARRLYDQAVTRMEKEPAPLEDRFRFRREAAELLGIDKQED